jgi:hypothetical protein
MTRTPKNCAVWEIHPGDENGSDSMKYWEIIADQPSAAGWSRGYCSAVTCRLHLLINCE